MKKFGITMLLAGTSLVASLFYDLSSRHDFRGPGEVAKKEIWMLKLFGVVATVLIIAGVSVTVYDRRH